MRSLLAALDLDICEKNRLARGSVVSVVITLYGILSRSLDVFCGNGIELTFRKDMKRHRPVHSELKHIVER